MIIYSFPMICYSCSSQFEVYSYIRFKTFYDDVSFPYKPWMMHEVYAETHKDAPFFVEDEIKQSLSYPVFTIGYNVELDREVLSKPQIKGVKLRYSGEAHTQYAANICPHCGKFTGRYYVLQKITDEFLYPNHPPKIAFEI